MAWVTPITDRTQSDIDNKTAKGYYNYGDLERLESDCKYLSDALGITISRRGAVWARTDLPTTAELARILSNISLLRNQVYKYPSTPAVPSAPLNAFAKANAAEQILSDIYQNYNDNLNNLNYAGQIYAGQGIGVI